MSMENIKKLRELTGAGLMDVKKALDESNNDIDAAIQGLKKNGIAKAAKKSGRVAAEGVVIAASNENRSVIFEVNSETDFVSSNEKFTEAMELIKDALLNDNEEHHEAESAVLLKVSTGETIEELLTNLTATIGERIYLRRLKAFNIKSESKSGSYTHVNKRVSAFINGKEVDPTILRDIAMHASAMLPEYLSVSDIEEEKVQSIREEISEKYKETMSDKPEHILNNIIDGAVKKALSEFSLLEQAFVKDPSKKVKDIIGSGILTDMELFILGDGIEKEINDFAKEVMEQVKK